MIKAFIAVVIELWEFVCKQKPRLLLAPDTSVQSPFPSKVALMTVHAGGHPSPRAIIIEDIVPLLKGPMLAFDTCISILTFPESVSVLATEGEFSQVRIGSVSGWVKTTSLEVDEAKVFPRFLTGATYCTADTETKKLRRLLTDESLGTALQLPLQPTEFVIWKIQNVTQLHIWNAERPRLQGDWQKIFRDSRGISIGIEPKTSSVLEYHTDTGEGKIAFVTSVHPDRSVVIQSVGREVEGQYLEETLSVDVWREWRPVFISFS